MPPLDFLLNLFEIEAHRSTIDNAGSTARRLRATKLISIVEVPVRALLEESRASDNSAPAALKPVEFKSHKRP